ncbi:hypothetical protein FRZ61_52300 [Hypericibacter adhaerens]|uniref:M23ase beta-sheet core domain-containing protein n=1 Tax=Hypericibacter adhaerens TaxID=2602016 RepID=A0A5J6N8F0_9PROT|nr:M23 family metallopeptidase [Hypericibacter adhaerens]QEX25283.1 hypothetical protein FRZ61_52300 [Hypericibacter adhaerens]
MTARVSSAPSRHAARIASLVGLVLLSLMLSEEGWAKPSGEPHEYLAAESQEAGATAPSDGQQIVELSLKRGDTLFDLLGAQGLTILNRSAVMQALEAVYDPRRLRPGDKIRLVTEPQAAGLRVRSLHLETGRAADLTVDIDAAKPRDRQGPLRAAAETHRVSGIAGTDFRVTLQRMALPKALIKEIVAALRDDPGMPSSPPAASHFSILYETLSRPSGAVDAELELIALDDGHRLHRIYRYRAGEGLPVYMHEDGHGVTLVRLGEPLRTEIVTSPYGWRIHPVFGDRRFHKGVDYGAPLGTPVFAVADGTVEDAGWRGNYGRYVRLDHGTGLATAYAHLSRIAKGLANGQHVRQGQVIGYVGQTGVATGPHLYYEVIVDGEQVDPLNLPDAIAVHLEGESLAGFRRYTRMLRQEASLF